MAETTTKDILKKFDAQLECPLCLDTFKQPKILPCFHVFCKSPCLEKLVIERSRSLICPICRRTVALSERGVDELQSDLKIDDLFDLRDSIKKVNITPVQRDDQAESEDDYHYTHSEDEYYHTHSEDEYYYTNSGDEDDDQAESDYDNEDDQTESNDQDYDNEYDQAESNDQDYDNEYDQAESNDKDYDNKDDQAESDDEDYDNEYDQAESNDEDYDNEYDQAESDYDNEDDQDYENEDDRLIITMKITNWHAQVIPKPHSKWWLQ